MFKCGKTSVIFSATFGKMQLINSLWLAGWPAGWKFEIEANRHRREFRFVLLDWRNRVIAVFLVFKVIVIV